MLDGSYFHILLDMNLNINLSYEIYKVWICNGNLLDDIYFLALAGID